MKQIIANSIFFLIFWNVGLSQEWHAVENKEAMVRVLMPAEPKFNSEDVFTIDGVKKKDVYSIQYNNMSMEFEVHQIIGQGEKAENRAIDQVIKSTTIENHGNINKKIKLKQNGLSYFYLEIPLISGELIRSVVYINNFHVIQMYVKGLDTNVFNDDANLFLKSWTLIEENHSEQEIVTSQKIKGEEFVGEEMKVWQIVKIDSSLEIQFPIVPFKKHSFVENGNNDINIDAFSAYDMEHRMNYIVTVRQYTRDQGQLRNDAIYSYYLDRIKENKRFKTIKSENIELPISGKEYVFSKGIQFYRLRLIRVNDSMYQFLIKGKRKSVFNEESQHFLNSINFTN